MPFFGFGVAVFGLRSGLGPVSVRIQVVPEPIFPCSNAYLGTCKWLRTYLSLSGIFVLANPSSSNPYFWTRNVDQKAEGIDRCGVALDGSLFGVAIHSHPRPHVTRNEPCILPVER